MESLLPQLPTSDCLGDALGVLATRSRWPLATPADAAPNDAEPVEP